MRVFVDTSALLALLVRSDSAHHDAARVFVSLRERLAELHTSSYVLVECYALIARRYGLQLVRSFRESFAPSLSVRWVDADLHERGLDLLQRREQRDLSLVDAVSFCVMRDARIDTAFAFDQHFADEGFALVTPPA